MSLSALSLTEATADIREGRIKSAELVADCLKRIEQVDGADALQAIAHELDGRDASLADVGGGLRQAQGGKAHRASVCKKRIVL